MSLKSVVRMMDESAFSFARKCDLSARGESVLRRDAHVYFEGKLPTESARLRADTKVLGKEPGLAKAFFSSE